MAGGADLIMPPEDSLSAVRTAYDTILDLGALEWAAVKRKLDRIDTSYRD